MIIGASRDPAKFGFKAVRAYRLQGHEVFPVNPHADEIDGVPCFRRVEDVPGPIERGVLYLPEESALLAIDAVARRADVGELWISPGADTPAVIAAAERAGVNAVYACAIVDIGVEPSEM